MLAYHKFIYRWRQKSLHNQFMKLKSFSQTCFFFLGKPKIGKLYMSTKNFKTFHKPEYVEFMNQGCH